MGDTWTVIVNSAAGGGRCGDKADAAVERLRKAGLELEVLRTERAGHATELTREAYAGGARQFIAVGGDGTSFEIVNGLFPRPEGDTDPVVLGFVPLGTGNSFLRDYSITSAEGAIDALLSGKRRTVDVVRVDHADGHLHYLNLMSLGFSAKVGALTNRRFKSFGAAGYALAVVSSVVGLQYPQFPMKVDGTPDDRECTLLSFSNSRFTGGTMMMAPDADAGDGEVDVVRIGRLGRIALLQAFPLIYKGTHTRLDAIETGRARRVEFDSDAPVDCMIDGEVLTLRLHALEVVPGQLEVVA